MNSRSLFLPLIFAMIHASAPAAFDLASAQPPLADKKPKDVTVHGDTRIDDYFWLREIESPAVTTYLKAENAYTETVTASTKPLQEKLYAEMVGRIKETDSTVPAKLGTHLYYTRTEQGKQYPIYCRKSVATPSAPSPAEQILLDVNALATGEKFMAIGHFAVSDDGTRLAYSIDRNGHRDYEVRIKDLSTGRELPQKIGVVSSLEWAADSDTLFYTTEEKDTKRSYRLERWRLSTGRHALLFEEKDEQYDIEIERSHDRHYLFRVSSSKTTTEIAALSANQPAKKFRLIVPRLTDHECHVEHRDGRFYFLTNLHAKNFRLVSAPVAKPASTHWTELIAHDPAVKLDTLDIFARHAVIHELANGLPRLRVLDFATSQTHVLDFPEPAYAIEEDENLEYDSDSYRFRYESLVTPESVIACNLADLTRTVLKQEEIPGGYDPANYASERIFVTAKDGASIPVALVYRRDLRRTSPQPTLLYGYGSYGIVIPDSFSTNRLSLLDRGMIFAIAHIRGGGEMGELWRDQGKMQSKMNTFTDFIACAEALVARGYTTPSHLAISGGSAGGLLMGAVVNLRPDLFQAAVYDVPFVDVINTMLDDSLPLTTSEYLEWGNPTVKSEYDWIRTYSPYDNIKPQPYPAILVNVSVNDSQVPYWEGAKLVAKLRVTKTNATPLLLKTNLDAGHGGASGRYDSLKELAFDHAFTLTALHVEK